MIGLLMVGMCWGCAGVEHKIDEWQSALREKLNFNTPKNASTDSKEAYFVHTAKRSGETLADVAKWYTGEIKNKEQLADLNPDVNPDNITAGGEVIIPVGLLETREPLPEYFSGDHREKYYKHTVRWPGESLSLIASWYTGSSKNWRKLAKVNPRLNPNRIKGDDVIMIPPALLKTRVPLPQKLAAKFTSDYFSYKVREKNEKLEDIATRYTGNSANRKLLARANPDLNPNHLKIGDEVYIPKKLLITRSANNDSAPASALSKSAVRTPAVRSKPVPTDDENIKLFGPKRHTK
jgi:hypothetical protein